MRTEVWLFALALLVALPARAELRRPSLQWTRGPGASTCIDPLTLAQRVEALTGPVFMPPHEYAIEGHIDAGARGWSLRLTVTGSDHAPRGERTIKHLESDCRSFDDAIVFVIALMIDPDLDLERLTGDATLAGHNAGDALLRELEANPARPVALEPAKKAVLSPPAPTPPYRWHGSLALAMGNDALRGAALGSALAVHFPITRWLEVGAQLRVLARVRPLDIDRVRSLRAQSFSLAPLFCMRPPSERVYTRLCVGPEPSLVRARGANFDPDNAATLAVWGALAQLELGYRLDDRWSLMAQGFVRIAFEDKRFVYRSLVVNVQQDVAQLARTSGGVAIGVAYRFGSGIDAPASTHLQKAEVTP